MPLNKILLAFQYTGYLLKKFIEQQHEQQRNIYRIAEVSKKSNQYKVVVQIIGKSTVVECTPQEIVADDRMLEGFSKKDIRAITYLACEQVRLPKYKVVMQDFCDGLNKILFKLKKTESNEIISKTAGQISLDNDLIHNLSHEDLRCVSYTAGYEQSHFDKNKK